MNLSEKYEFRSIRKDEADQATEIEQICFPPAETISRKDIIDRVEKIPELFLVAEDRETGKLAGYLTGLATDEEVFQDKFFTDAEEQYASWPGSSSGTSRTGACQGIDDALSCQRAGTGEKESDPHLRGWESRNV